jgi:hypothetical protein
MKIITRAVLDWDGNVLEQDSFEYAGPLTACKSSGTAPTAVDPYTQASAQYGLDTGTANYNARLNRTNSSNPLGSNTWNITGYDGSGAGGIPGTNTSGATPTATPVASSNPYPAGSYLYTLYNQNTANGTQGTTAPTGSGAYGLGGGATGTGTGGTGAPEYSQSTSLTPWANQMLSSPIDTSGLAGMPGGPSTTADLATTRNSLYNQQEAYIKPQQDLAGEQLDSKLANEGITPGSAAYTQAMDQQSRQNTFTDNQTINSAITGGGAEQSRLFGLGSQGLQNQLAVRDAPISEYEKLTGNPTSQVSAATPDISGAFNQQLQSQLGAYNASTATNNANTSAAGSAASAYLMYLALSDERTKYDIKKVGELDSGPGIYTYKYKGDTKPQIGVMAQELEETHPQAVFSLGGLKMVDYAAI